MKAGLFQSLEVQGSVGRVGSWDIGLLDMQTQAFKSMETKGVDLPSENFGVLRLRRQVINKYSYVGGILTSRLGMDGTYNEVIGLDGIIRVFGDDYLDVKYAQSFDEKYQNNPVSMAASRIWLDWQRRNEKGLGYDFFYSRAGEKFTPDLGFELRNNYYLLGTKMKYGWIPGESSPISTHMLLLNGQAWKEIGSNVTQSSIAGIGYSMQFKSSWGAQMLLNHAGEMLTDTFYLSKDAVLAFVPPDKYGYNYGMVNIHTPYTKLLTFDITSNIGQYYDGNQFTLRIMSTIKMGAFLSLSPFYEYDKVLLPSRDQSFTGHITSLSALIMINSKLSISSLFQYSNIAHGIVTNVRIRYNPREGNDFYLVFNEGRNIELNRESPTLNPVSNRGVLLKYTYTFVL